MNPMQTTLKFAAACSLGVMLIAGCDAAEEVDPVEPTVGTDVPATTPDATMDEGMTTPGATTQPMTP